MDNQTIEKYNTMQFRPDKVDCNYIHDYTMIELSSYYFSSSNRKFHNSKIMRVLFCDPNREIKSNIFSYLGSNPYKEVITLLIEQVSDFKDVVEYIIVLLHNDKITHLQEKDKNPDNPWRKLGSGFYEVVRFTDYQQAREELNRLEEELKTSLDCLDSFK